MKKTQRIELGAPRCLDKLSISDKPVKIKDWRMVALGRENNTMKHPNTMTVTEFAKLGGKARAEKLSAKRMSEIGKLGVAAAKASGKRLGRPKKQKTSDMALPNVPQGIA